MSENKRLTYRDKIRLSKAIRRVFVLSDLYKEARAMYKVEHSDMINNPRCKKWTYCGVCGIVLPEWKTDLDHIEPVVPIDNHMEDMSLDLYVDRVWCEILNLQSICNSCHTTKSQAENRLRKPFEKPRNKPLTRKKRTKKQ